MELVPPVQGKEILTTLTPSLSECSNPRLLYLLYFCLSLQKMLSRIFIVS
jgi:hypothetical protein